MVLKEELAFRKSGTYSADKSDLKRIFAEIYDNAEVMEGYYLIGLYATYFIWPHHYRMLDFYRREFLNGALSEVRTYAEWGVGHGLLSIAALAQWPAATGWLFDLSAHSLSFAESMLTAAGVRVRCTFVQGNVVIDPDLPVVDRLVCSEVLEHVARPDSVLERVRAARTLLQSYDLSADDVQPIGERLTETDIAAHVALHRLTEAGSVATDTPSRTPAPALPAAATIHAAAPVRRGMIASVC